jgi:hypothetical protein
VRSPILPGFFLILVLWAQADVGGEDRISQSPRQLFVGDRGRLAVSLGPEFQNTLPFIISDSRLLPQSPDLTLHRLEFDPRRGQLLIDFTAFAPGELEVPPINLPQLPGFRPEGYRISIASTLGRGDSDPFVPQAGGILVLSNPAPPLAVPGTALLIYGSSSLIILLLLLALGAGIWGRPYLQRLMEARRRRRLIRLMGDIGEKLRRKIPWGAYQEILRKLSVEFRAFLGYFFDPRSGGDCRAMTAEEFGALPPLFAPAEGEEPVSPSSLALFFHRLDRLRFSGEQTGEGEIAALLDQMEGILRAVDLGFRGQE